MAEIHELLGTEYAGKIGGGLEVGQELVEIIELGVGIDMKARKRTFHSYGSFYKIQRIKVRIEAYIDFVKHLTLLF